MSTQTNYLEKNLHNESEFKLAETIPLLEIVTDDNYGAMDEEHLKAEQLKETCESIMYCLSQGDNAELDLNILKIIVEYLEFEDILTMEPELVARLNQVGVFENYFHENEIQAELLAYEPEEKINNLNDSLEQSQSRHRVRRGTAWCCLCLCCLMFIALVITVILSFKNSPRSANIFGVLFTIVVGLCAIGVACGMASDERRENKVEEKINEEIVLEEPRKNNTRLNLHLFKSILDRKKAKQAGSSQQEEKHDELTCASNLTVEGPR